MSVGLVVSDRFEIQRLIGTGGMGEVYKARDRLTGGPVAVKILHHTFPLQRDIERFQREAQLLAELSHPRVVRYVAHGITPTNRPYLAMEWLDGEDLAERLARGALDVPETVALGRRVAEALGALHERGIVHRDIKPSNIFLPDGDIQQVKLVDLGIARMAGAGAAFSGGPTRTGVMIGTPGYMAPEQARGEKDIDARADVFSLGCVLFECLVGRPTFVGDNVAALLAKILLEDAPRASTLKKDIPPLVDAMLARMLSKHAQSRPADGTSLARELGKLTGETLSSEPPRPRSETGDLRGLTRGERRLVSVVMASANDHLLDADAARAPTMHGATVEATYDVSTVVAPFSAEYECLADGSLVVTVTGKGSATDQAAHAARCALALRRHIPNARMALATGLASVEESLVVGEVIDRAARLLDHEPSSRAERQALPVRLDPTTAGLLDLRFDVGGDSAGLVLRGPRELVSSARTLLGRPTPCVGRERELSSLVALFQECVSEPLARAVLVTAPPGVGKSRVAHELVRRLRDLRPNGLEVWIAHGDAMSEGSPFAMLAQGIRRAAGCLEGEPLVVRQQKIDARVGRHLRGEDRQRVTEFLGELVGSPFSDRDSVQLRAARQDAMLMGDQMRRAWEDWLSAECKAQPVIIVLEDLHWGDLPSVKFLDSALRNLEERPLMVVAFARPEVHDVFPHLWSERSLQEVRLGALTKKASVELVRSVLGDSLAEDVVASLVDRAGGNAFYLEELIRAVAERGGDALPGTVLAMVEARLERLDPEARRVLRAASVFGQVFWQGGVASLLGGHHKSDTDDWLTELTSREVITRRASTTFPGETEYAFRHALLREAAYAMLTLEDRTLGHRLAGGWLEEAGESEGVVLAEHFERGGLPARAIEWYRRAAEQAIEGNDLAVAMDRAEHAITCGATGEVLGGLRLLQTEACNWYGELEDAARCGREALAHLPSGSDKWFVAAGEMATVAWRQAAPEKIFALAAEAEAAPEGAPVTAARVIGTARIALRLFWAGGADVGARMLAWIDAEGITAASEPSVLGWVAATRSQHAKWLGDTEREVELAEAAVRAFEAAGDLRNACVFRQAVAAGLYQFGMYDESEKHLRQTLEDANRMGLQATALAAKHVLGADLSRKGSLLEGIRVEREAVEGFKALGDRIYEATSRVYLALMLRLLERLDEAEVEVRIGVGLLQEMPPIVATAYAVLATIEIERGNVAAALELDELALKLYAEAKGVVIDGEAFVHLAHAEALNAAGDEAGARAAIASARDRLMLRADKIQNRLWRRSFLDKIRENARTLARAGEWLR